jgi:hypothetical protein
MNTRIDLEYRDADNFRKGEVVVVSGAITGPMIEAIRSNLEDDMFIIANQVGLPTPAEKLHSDHGGPKAADHVYTIMEGWDDDELRPEDLLTSEPPTHDLSIGELAQKIASARWDVPAEMDRQGIPD